MANPFAGFFSSPGGNPFAGLFGRDETEEERRRRELLERLRRNAALGEEQYKRLNLPAREGQEAPDNPLFRRVGKDIASGLYGAAGLVAYASPLTGMRVAPAALQRADELQQSAGFGHPGGEARDEYIAYQLSRGASPVGAAVAETIGAIGGFSDPTDVLVPAGGGLLAARRMLRRRMLRRRFLRRVPKPEPALAEAMAHAGSASSPEAISRMRGGTRFYEVSPGGEVRPMIGVEAVDTAPRKGYAKVRVSANGEVVVEEGRLSRAGQKAVAAEATQARRAPRVDEAEGVIDLTGESDESVLAALGVKTGAGAQKLARRDPRPAQELLGPSGPPPRSGAPRESVRGADDPIRDGYLEKYGGKPGDRPPAESWLRRTWNRFYEEAVNRDDPIERFAKESGRPGLTRLVQRLRGSKEISRGPLERGTTRLDPEAGNFVYTGEPLREVISGLDGEGLADLDGLLMARRHLELADRAKSPRGKLLDIDPEATMDSAAYMAHLREKLGPQGFQEMNERASRVSAWAQRAILEPLSEVGLVSREARDAILRENASYAPFMRLVDEVEGTLSGSGASFIKPIKGGLSSSSKVSSPLEELVLKSQRVQQWVESQRVRNSLADAIDANPELALSKELVPAKKGDYNKGNTFTAWRDGEAQNYSASKEILRALDVAGGNGDASLLLKAASFPARMLRSGATLTLEFIARNPLRDQFTAGLVSRYGYVPFYDLAKGFFYASPPGRRLSKVYDEYLDSGSSIVSMAEVDRPHAARSLRDLAGTGAASRARKFLSSWRKEGALYPLQVLSAATEQGTRVGAFARARKAGATHLDAMAEAREISLDFGRAGRSGREANTIYAFLNAEIQDIDRVARAFKERPVATSTKALGYITIPSVANYLKNRKDPDYQGLPEWEKATYVHLGKLADGRWIRFPRPIGSFALVSGYGVQKFLEYAETQDPQALEELGERLASDTVARYATNPGELAPTGLQPLVEASAGPGGWSYWRDQPIVPRSLQSVDPSQQFFDDTPQMLKDAGAATGQSPLKLQHLVRGYSAGLGVSAMEILDSYYREARGIDRPQKKRDLGRVPLVKGFVSASPFGFSSKPVSLVYERVRQAETSKRTYENLRESSPDVAFRYRQDHPEIRELPQLRRLRKRLRELRKERERIKSLAHTRPEWRAEMLLQIDQTATHYARQELEILDQQGSR